jgi:hypothetical protein
MGGGPTCSSAFEAHISSSPQCAAAAQGRPWAGHVAAQLLTLPCMYKRRGQCSRWQRQPACQLPPCCLLREALAAAGAHGGAPATSLLPGRFALTQAVQCWAWWGCEGGAAGHAADRRGLDDVPRHEAQDGWLVEWR